MRHAGCEDVDGIDNLGMATVGNVHRVAAGISIRLGLSGRALKRPRHPREARGRIAVIREDAGNGANRGSAGRDRHP